MRSYNYILRGKEPILCRDINTWGEWFLEISNRRVADNTIGDTRVSTVFLGVDHNWDGKGPPVLFETMIFGGDHDGYRERYATWDEAEEGHRRSLARLDSRRPS